MSNVARRSLAFFVSIPYQIVSWRRLGLTEILLLNLYNV